MAAPSAKEEHTPAVLGGDLPARERIAYEEAHDADIPSNEGVAAPEDASLKKETTADAEKGVGRDVSSISSENGAPSDGDLEKGQPPTTEEEEELVDPNIVDWDGPEDPQNPQNWTKGKKWLNVGILSFLTLLTPLASSMFAPGVPSVIQDFHTTNQSLATFVVSIYILGFAFGPLVLAPLSEMYGRVLIYNVCNIVFTCFTVACALATDMNMLIGFRFLAGIFGVAPITNGGGTIADLMAPEARGAAMSIWAIGRKFSRCPMCWTEKLC